MLHRIALTLVVVSCVVLLSARKAEPSSDVQQVWESGNAFLYMCHDLGKPSEELTQIQMLHANMCMNYLNGLDDGVSLAIGLSNQSGNLALLPYCFPPAAARIQQYLVLIKYVQDNPAQAHLQTATLFGRAMKAAFPCPTH
jgi:hypothetical protein